MSGAERPGASSAGRAGFLAGLTILELGDGIAGSGATSLLVGLGAEVTAVIDPTSPHRRARPRTSTTAGPVSLLPVILDRGKRIVCGDDLDVDGIKALLARGHGHGPFDLVIVDRVEGLRGPLAAVRDIPTYASFVAGANRRAWLSISAFGLSGARRDDLATEITLAAAGGMLATVRDASWGNPLKLAGYQSLLNCAQAAALASCHAVDLARDGQPAHLDLSAVEATIAMGPTLEIATVLLNTGGPAGAKRYGAPASFYRCQDGLVRISAMEDHQWRGVVAAMDSPDWADRFATTAARIEYPEEIDRRIGEWTSTLTKTRAETLLQSHGVPATAMYSPAETLESPQLRHRGSFEPVRLPGGLEATVVGAQYRPIEVERTGDVVAEGTGSPTGRRGRSLRGLNVVEASHVLAAPLAGALLGAMGAQVTKLEDLRRLDMYRRRGPYIDQVAGGERSAYFALVNHSKRSVAFDLEESRERLDDLLANADVVIENLGGRRATALGLAAGELVKHRPDVLAVSSSGFGQDGPSASYRAYAYNLQASCCLGYLTRNEQGEQAEIDLPWADLVSGFALATIVAAWAVGPRGNDGAGVDFAMADLIVAHFNEFIAAASLSADSDAHVDRANEMFPYAPNGVYTTEDGWIAISVADDQQFAQLIKILDSESLGNPEFADAQARFERRRVLDAVLADAASTWKAGTLARDLRAAGVAAEEVVGPRQLPESAGLRSRDFFTSVEHPEWGRRRLIGIPWRPFGQPAIALGAPPRLAAEAPEC
ncbi:CoA transferase [Frankia sp. AgB1.9]|uniref:CoA transferase n=1 Tax=unclassified Frankia TaxID=2632575 RepID=UPI0019314D1C|nr:MULTISPECIES: CoA transferase [unclassified Frankia]MBL7488159.1 CoA transferase [Frankia sp. AgW1.1]MBL7553319.1 CoA transferase [Frankia sp. AgB1.9]MBL7620162.1 CoA transferase [Frankia sp. AgB1.8]